MDNESLAKTETSKKFQPSHRYDLHSEMWFCGAAALQNPKEKARWMILNFDEEVVWSNHHNLSLAAPDVVLQVPVEGRRLTSAFQVEGQVRLVLGVVARIAGGGGAAGAVHHRRKKNGGDEAPLRLISEGSRYPFFHRGDDFDRGGDGQTPVRDPGDEDVALVVSLTAVRPG